MEYRALFFYCLLTITSFFDLNAHAFKNPLMQPLPFPDRENTSEIIRSGDPLLNFDKSSHPLFTANQPISVMITAPFNQLFENKNNFKKTLEKVEGTFEINRTKIPMKLRLRGNSTRALCPFPKLKLYFAAEDTRGTMLEGIRQLNLGTHCGVSDSEVKRLPFAVNNNKFNHREAVLYRWAADLGLPMPAVRPAFITYKNKDRLFSDYSGGPYQALLIEDIESVGERAGLKVHKFSRSELSQEKKHVFDLDLTYLFFAEMFEKFIANGDWFISLYRPGVSNFYILETPDERIIPLAYDFDLSASVGQNSRPRAFDAAYFKFIGPETYLLNSRKEDVRLRFLAAEEKMNASLEFLESYDREGYLYLKEILKLNMNALRAIKFEP